MPSIMKIKGTSLDALSEALTVYMPEAVSVLANQYNFNADEALSKLGAFRVEKEGISRRVKVNRVVPKILLPFCGVVQDDWCKAVRYNRGLFTQCTNARKDDKKYCKTCMKSLNKTGGTCYGDIEERGNEEWSSIKGKIPVNYGNIMTKIGVTKEQAIDEANKLGWTIPKDQFEVVKTRKGRPAKNAKEADENPKKQRGRPKKSKPVVDGAGIGDDLIAQLLQNAQMQNEEVVDKETEDEESVVGSEPTLPPAQQTDEESTKSKLAAEKKTPEENEAAKLAKAEAKSKLAAEKKAAKEAAKLVKVESKAKLAAEKKAAKEVENKAAKKTAETLAKKTAETLAKKTAETLAMASAETLAEEEEEEEEEEIEVEKFTHEGVEYLLGADGMVYDAKSQEEIGKWDNNTKKLSLF